jgi:TatD DNase family protein
MEKIDLSHVVLETDSPYLAPVPYRGKRNESSYLKLVVEKIAQVKNISVDFIAEITTGNAASLF